VNAGVTRPSVAEVWAYLEKWDNLSVYAEQEKALSLLFQTTFPKNTELREVLIKCSVLNDFYGTNIYGVFPVARHIVRLGIDERLARGDVTVVGDIATGHGILAKSGKEISFFSFATKYCSHHRPNAYPIYDGYVDAVLRYFRNEDGFAAFRNDDLRKYERFKRVICEFQEYYSLEQFTVKELDEYLWQLGKAHFPKSYVGAQPGGAAK
jgi:hypothetical protein